MDINDNGPMSGRFGTASSNRFCRRWNTMVSELHRKIYGKEGSAVCGNPTDLVEIIQLSLSQLGDIWGPTKSKIVFLRWTTPSYRYPHSLLREGGVLEVTPVSSECLRIHAARNKPSACLGGVAGPGDCGSNGSCIFLVGDTGEARNGWPRPDSHNHNSKCETIT